MATTLSSHSPLLYTSQLHSIMASLTLHGSGPEAACLFSNLPCEIFMMVFENLSDFEALLATILTCKWSMRFFQDDQNTGKIVFSVFSNILCTASRYNHEGNTEKGSSLIIRQMYFAAQKVLIPRQHVLSIFGECWQFLERRELEELLIPTGRRLALSLVSEDDKSKAVEFLETIESGQYCGTKDISCHSKRLTLLPLLELKASLQGKPLKPSDPRYEELPLLIVEPDGIFLKRSNTQWHCDIFIREKWAIARISKLPPQIVNFFFSNRQSRSLKTNADKQKVQIERHQAERQRAQRHRAQRQAHLLLSGASIRWNFSVPRSR